MEMETRRLKRRIKRLQNDLNHFMILNKILTALTIFFAASWILTSYSLHNERIISNENDMIISELQSSVERLSEDNMNMAKEMDFINAAFNTLYDKYTDLKAVASETAIELEMFREREELYNKYEYALFYNGDRTDVDYEHISSLENIAEEREMGDDAVALALALVATESHGIANSENSDSSAAGLGQMIYSTAKSVYEKSMNNGPGTYEYSYALDPELNLSMVIHYIGDLADTTGRDPVKVVTRYRGLYDESYIWTVDHKLRQCGLSLYTIVI